MSSEEELDVCYRVCGWCHLVKATEVTAGLAESNGSLRPGGWLKTICGLTACTPGSALGQTLSNEYGRTLLFLLCPQYVYLFVCLSVCRSARISQKPHGWTSPNFTCMLPVAVDRSSSDDTLCTSGFVDDVVTFSHMQSGTLRVFLSGERVTCCVICLSVVQA